ncbi:hypothetical protein MVEN_02405800 [Mycena venus]|uniref:Uncharacterized protein n=1 Tax=Mycena venus TaxID=2733690 RepID=A0A8H7CDA5_9AGAR|nr:hypothetical protein MVEN_02405800 [Mycena venus]
MASFTTTILSSFARIFFPPTSPALSSSQSDPDVAAERAAANNRPRPASSASVRLRPRSAIEGYWSWDGPSSGVVLRQKTSRDPGLKGLADVKLAHSSPVFACRPLRMRTLYPVADVSNTPAAHLLEEVNIGADVIVLPTPDTSFDISLISDTSISTSEDHDADESESDTSFTLPPPPASPIGLGIGGLFKHDGSPFDGMGVVSFGCDAAGHGGAPRPSGRDVKTGGLSRVFLEEAAWTWAADPHHRMLTIIQEDEEELQEEEESQVWANFEREQEHVINQGTAISSRKSRSKTSVTRPVIRTRDLSTVDTISSGLKRRQNPRPKTSASAARAPPAPTSRSPSVAPGSRRAGAAQPAWRG